MQLSINEVSAGVSSRWPSRTDISRLSRWWVRLTSGVSEKIPAEPLRVCTARNNWLTASWSAGLASRRSRLSSASLSRSRPSLRKPSRSWFHCSPLSIGQSSFGAAGYSDSRFSRVSSSCTGGETRETVVGWSMDDSARWIARSNCAPALSSSLRPPRSSCQGPAGSGSRPSSWSRAMLTSYRVRSPFKCNCAGVSSLAGVSENMAWSSEQFFHGRQQLLGLERFDDPGPGSGGLAFGFLRLLAFGGKHDDRREAVLVARLDLFHQADAIEVGHVHVADDQVDLLAVEFGQCVAAIAGLDDLVTGGGQAHLHQLAHGQGVVDDQDGLGHVHHSCKGGKLEKGHFAGGAHVRLAVALFIGGEALALAFEPGRRILEAAVLAGNGVEQVREVDLHVIEHLVGA